MTREHTDGIRTRELAYRADGGLAVSLLWNPPGDAVSVVVTDTLTGEGFHFAPEKRRAFDAFYHPYAHASRRTTGSLR